MKSANWCLESVWRPVEVWLLQMEVVWRWTFIAVQERTPWLVNNVFYRHACWRWKIKCLCCDRDVESTLLQPVVNRKKSLRCMIILCFANMLYVICQPLAACVWRQLAAARWLFLWLLSQLLSVSQSAIWRGVAAGWLRWIVQLSWHGVEQNMRHLYVIFKVVIYNDTSLAFCELLTHRRSAVTLERLQVPWILAPKSALLTCLLPIPRLKSFHGTPLWPWQCQHLCHLKDLVGERNPSHWLRWYQATGVRENGGTTTVVTRAY